MLPETPPDFLEIIGLFSTTAPKRISEIITLSKTTDEKGRYLHWNKLKYLDPPEGLTREEWWAGIKMNRSAKSSSTVFQDKTGSYFKYSTPAIVQKDLYWLDIRAAGSMSDISPAVNPDTQRTFLIRTLMEEAIHSSILEGAATTRAVAREMLRQGREPKDQSEWMIYNNYNAMQFIRDIKKDELNPSIIFELHKILTENTLDDPKDAGRFRTADKRIQIIDIRDNTVLHNPPNAGELPDRLKLLCAFANETSDLPEVFVHPIIKAIILHFMLAYDHPFVDGNGRTARALFYWSVMKSGYWLMEYISISRVIRYAPVKYSRAFLHTETDDNDLTYFIIHQLSVINKAVRLLFAHLESNSREISDAENMLDRSARLRNALNHRQIYLLRHALKHPGDVYTIRTHQRTHGIVYETARKDLFSLSDRLNLLRKRKSGKTYFFIAPDDLKNRIEQA